MDILNPPAEQHVAADEDVQYQAREYLEDSGESLALESIRNKMKGRGIKWNNGISIDLQENERSAVVSRISTAYHDGRGHDGVQRIERSTDGIDASLYAYLYLDHGFGNYEIIGRIKYDNKKKMN